MHQSGCTLASARTHNETTGFRRSFTVRKQAEQLCFLNPKYRSCKKNREKNSPSTNAMPADGSKGHSRVQCRGLIRDDQCGSQRCKLENNDNGFCNAVGVYDNAATTGLLTDAHDSKWPWFAAMMSAVHPSRNCNLCLLCPIDANTRSRSTCSTSLEIEFFLLKTGLKSRLPP